MGCHRSRFTATPAVVCPRDRRAPCRNRCYTLDYTLDSPVKKLAPEVSLCPGPHGS